MRQEAEPGARPVLDLSLELSAHMLVLARVDDSLEAAHARLRRVLEAGDALECFRQNVAAQGGEVRVCDDPAAFLPLVSESMVGIPRSGFITEIETTEIGHAIAALGGGRVRIEDKIDPTVGFLGEKQIGEKVEKGELLGTVYARDQAKARETVAGIQAAYSVGDASDSQRPTLIKEVINE